MNARRSTPKVSEAELQQVVIQTAQHFGWLVHHGRPAINKSGRWSTPVTGNVGFPDLVMARRGVVLIVELKSDAGRHRPEQVLWADAITGDTNPQEGDRLRYYTWRPADWRDGLIAELLR